MFDIDEFDERILKIVRIVSVKDMAEFEAFALRFLTENPHVKRYITNIVISEVKSEFVMP